VIVKATWLKHWPGGCWIGTEHALDPIVPLAERMGACRMIDKRRTGAIELGPRFS